MDGKTQLLDNTLFKKIKSAIDNYFFSGEGLDTDNLSMTRPQTFRKLVDLIESENKGVDLTTKYMISLYRGEKTNHNTNKEILHAICKTLKIEDDEESSLLKEIILNFKKLCENDERVKDFAGTYKLFLGGRQQPSLYDKVYENTLVIFHNGIVKITNPFSKKTFWGYSLIREAKTLEILSFDFVDTKIVGVGTYMNFKVNEYKKLSYFFPGVNFGFDSATMPIIFHALLCSDTSVTKTNKIVDAYFDDVAKNLRMEIPSLTDTERLREFFKHHDGESTATNNRFDVMAADPTQQQH